MSVLILGRKFGEAILLAGTLFLFSFVYLSFFLFFQFVCSTYSPVVCSTTFLASSRNAPPLREDTKNGCRKQTIASGRWPEILLTFFNIYLKIHLFGFFSIFKFTSKTYLKRPMITLDWLQIKLKLRKCWKEKNHGHRHEVDSSRIPPQRTWGTGDKVPRMSAWRATAMLLSFKTLHLLRRLLEAQGNRGIRY